MSRLKKSDQIKNQIIKSTDNLLYQKGYNAMSFSDIAKASGVPRGNINYHFKTKEQILFSVIEYRLENMRQLLNTWQKELSTPLSRLKRFAQIPVIEIKNITLYGCPMGSLNTELAKFQPELQAYSRKQLDCFKNWLEQQFKQMLPEQNATSLAVHLLCMSQGIAIMAQAYRDEQLVVKEVEQVQQWLDALH